MKEKVREEQKVRCIECGAVLGIIQPRGIAVRRADFRGVAEGWHDVVCYRCGTLNALAHPGTQAAR